MSMLLPSGLLTLDGSPTPALMDAIRHSETGHLSDAKAGQAVSKKDAIGAYQFLRKNLHDMGYGMPKNISVADATDIDKQRDLATQYVKGINKHHKYTNPMHSLAAYNWGAGNVDKWLAKGGKFSELPKETRDYLMRASKFLNANYQAPQATPTNQDMTKGSEAMATTLAERREELLVEAKRAGIPASKQDEFVNRILASEAVKSSITPSSNTITSGQLSSDTLAPVPPPVLAGDIQNDEAMLQGILQSKGVPQGMLTATADDMMGQSVPDPVSTVSPDAMSIVDDGALTNIDNTNINTNRFDSPNILARTPQVVRGLLTGSALQDDEAQKIANTPSYLQNAGSPQDNNPQTQMGMFGGGVLDNNPQTQQGMLFDSQDNNPQTQQPILTDTTTATPASTASTAPSNKPATSKPSGSNAIIEAQQASLAKASEGRRNAAALTTMPTTEMTGSDLIRIGLAGVGGSAQGGLNALDRMGEVYGQLEDAKNSSALEKYKADLKAAGKKKTDGDNNAARVSSGIVTGLIDEVMPTINDDINGLFNKITGMGGNTTGFFGKIMSGIGGSDAANLRAQLTTIKSNVGFDKLQSMREASPTGGALGNVSEKENEYLQSVLGNLEQSQSPEQLKRNLMKLREAYLDIVHGYGNRPFGTPNYSGASPAQGNSNTQTINGVTVTKVTP